jgi:hypothetical protein
MHITFPPVKGRPRAYIGRLHPALRRMGVDLAVELPSDGDGSKYFSEIGFIRDGQWAVNFDVLRELAKLTGLDDWYNGILHPIHVEANGPSTILAFSRGQGMDSIAIANAIHVLETESTCNQGTAFSIGPSIVCTCAHCVNEDTELIETKPPFRRFSTKVLTVDQTRDVAVLEVIGLKVPRWLPIFNSELHNGVKPIAFGFPRYQLGDSVQRVPLTITGTRQFHGLPLQTVTGGIIAGMSGCPILDDRRRVIGIAIRGGVSHDDSAREEFQAILGLNIVWDLVSGLG